MMLQQLYFTGFILFFFFGILQLSLKNRLYLNYALALLFFTGGYELFYYWTFISKIILKITFLAHTEIAVSYLIGPVFFFYFSMALGFYKRFKKKYLIHAIPFFISLFLLIIIKNNPDYDIIYETYKYKYFPLYSEGIYLNYLATASDVSIAGYLLITILKIWNLLRGQKSEKEIRLLVFFLLSMILSASVLIVGGMTGLNFLLIFGVGSFTLIGAVYILFSFRYPEFSMKVLKEAKQLQKNKSNIENIDVEKILIELNTMMHSDKLYKQEDLNLKLLSSKLNITSHQLSRILNEHMEKNFRTFVNAYRIEEAILFLESAPEMSILEISMEVGFNSKSTFYTAFQKETGSLPVEYRNNKLIK